ncbi:TetR/AcrR family transcriptional regulator [Streptomyces sp. C]|uniref:TetR/AcrR family transcriptional regulator n=1 Tax=Streptomyces sp. C TaxID=253839 RepID=UPI0001B53C9F|nr:TetR/AcrR family transcriptional regulator [Streptomyces sp. C]
MVKQERAVRTRNTAVRAAASEFYRAGYGGTSLKAISQAAGISMGAVTFHFDSKAELAEAVAEEGCSAVRTALDDAAGRRRGKALDGLGSLLLELARLLRDDVTVRASAHLARELPDIEDWTTLWHPVVAGLAQEAHERGELHAPADPASVTALVAHLLWGAEATLRGAYPDGQAAALDQLEGVWLLVLEGIGPDTP